MGVGQVSISVPSSSPLFIHLCYYFFLIYMQESFLNSRSQLLLDVFQIFLDISDICSQCMAYILIFMVSLFFLFWLCWVFVAARGLSLVGASAGYSSLRCTGFSLWWLLLLWSTGSRHICFSSCGMQAQQLWLMGSRVQDQLWHTGLAAPWHVGSYQTRDRTRVPCIGRWILNHCPTKEVLYGVSS